MAPGSRADQPEIRGHAPLKNLMNIFGDVFICLAIVGTLEKYLSILHHLQKLVELHRMQLPDLIQKQYAAVGLGHSTRLGLRQSCLPIGSCSLIDGVMDAPDQGIGNGPFIKADTGRIHLNEFRIRRKGRPRALFRHFQGQPRRAGLSHARRVIDENMLGVLSAERRCQRPDPLLLAHDLPHGGGAGLFRKRHGQMHMAKGAQFLQLFFRMLFQNVFLFTPGFHVGKHKDSHSANKKHLGYEQ